MTRLPADGPAGAARYAPTTPGTTKLPFGCVVTAHGAMVLRLCRAVLSPPAADQAWIDAFLTAMGAYPRLPDGASIVAWLLAIAERTINDARSSTRRTAHGDTAPSDCRTDT